MKTLNPMTSLQTAALVCAVVLSACSREIPVAAAKKDAPAANSAPESAALPVADRAGETEISYAIELEQAADPVRVKEDWRFRSGDRFRLVLRPGFNAYVYVADRGRGQNTYQILFPHEKVAIRNLIQPGREVRVPETSAGWMRMDAEPGDENLVVIAATAPLEEFDNMPAEVDREEFEARLARVERRQRPGSWRRFEDKDWVKLFAAREKGDMAIVLRLPLEHR